jgi:hypothetical protein
VLSDSLKFTFIFTPPTQIIHPIFPHPKKTRWFLKENIFLRWEGGGSIIRRPYGRKQTGLRKLENPVENQNFVIV